MRKIEYLFNNAKNKQNEVGAYTPVYQYIYDVLIGKYDRDNSKPIPIKDKEVHKVQLWFSVAARANADKGPFSTLIREYTKEQARLRNIHISDEKMQQASNAVGFRAISDLIEKNKQNKSISLNDIAQKDATAVGDILFKGIKDNAAWSGAVLFGGLGKDETWRLWGKDGTINSKDECINVNFAKLAYEKAYDKTNSLYSIISNAFSEKDKEILLNLSYFNKIKIPKNLSDNYPRIAEIETMLRQKDLSDKNYNQTIQDFSQKYENCSKEYDPFKMVLEQIKNENHSMNHYKSNSNTR